MTTMQSMNRDLTGAVALLLGGLVSAGSPAQETAASPPAETQAGEQVLATVNGQPVLLEDIEQRLGSLHKSASEAGKPGDIDMERLMFQVVNDVLLGQEARALEMEKDEKLRSKVDKFRDETVVRLLQREEIGDRVEPTDEEVRKVFREEYKAVTLRIVTAYEQADAEEMLRLLQDGDDMTELARERSVDPYAQRGGIAYELPRVDLQREISRVAFQLQPGQVAGPIRTDLGWSVIRVESFTEADPARFQELEPLCRRIARMTKKKMLEGELAARAQENIKVTVDSEVAATVQPERLPDGRLMPKVENKEAIVAHLGELRVITAGDYSRALVGRWKGVRNIEAANAAAPIILRNLVDEELLVTEAIRRGYDKRPDVRRLVHAYETQLLVPFYLEEMVGRNVQVSSDEIKAHYEAHKEEYHRPPRVRLAQITVETEEEARLITEQLRKGTDFTWLAKQKSIDRLKDAGGDRGWYVPEPGFDDYNEALFTAQVGDVLEPFGIPGNYIVLKVTARQEQGIYDFKEISGNVREAVFQENLLAEMEAFMEKLRSRAEIEINEELLAQLDITGRQERAEEKSGMGDGHGH
jgi:peptidyl-prolyl cis-trans isomerase C